MIGQCCVPCNITYLYNNSGVLNRLYCCVCHKTCHVQKSLDFGNVGWYGKVSSKLFIIASIARAGYINLLYINLLGNKIVQTGCLYVYYLYFANTYNGSR